jgi:AbrB family looped-hinge helix DNA binding protein
MAGSLQEADMARATLRSRGQVTLPPEVREALGVADGDELDFEITATGEVCIRGLRLIPSDQAWFWTESWQRGESDADEDLAAGRVARYDSEDIFLKSLGSD